MMRYNVIHPVVHLMNCMRKDLNLVECTIDLDGIGAKDDLEALVEHLNGLKRMNRVKKVFVRRSSSGEGYHVSIFFIMPKQMRHLRENKEFLFMLRYALFDDVARVNADNMRFSSGSGQENLMQLFEGKAYYDMDLNTTRYRHCGEWEEIQ